MKRVQPLYILLTAVALLLVAGAAVFGVRLFSTTYKGGSPVEPQIFGENGLFDLWFVSAEITDISVDRNVTGILFATEAGKVSLLDRERRLRWEKRFSTQPLQAKLSSCGNYLALGTTGGKLFYMHTDQSAWWEKDLDEPVYRLAMSANGRWVIAASGNPEDERHQMKLYNHRGELQWQIDSGHLGKIYLTGEQPGLGRIYYGMHQGDTAITGAVTLEGEPLWSVEGYELIALSRTGNRRLATVNDEELVVYNIHGEEVWKTELEIRVAGAEFNPQNGNLLLYGSGDDATENFYYYSSPGGELLWKQRIADGALFAFTADGRQIITGSWRHYRDDYTQMALYDNSGNELNRWEAAMRVERLLVAGSRRYIILVDEDGYIDILDMQAQLGEEEFVTAVPLYVPAVVGEPGDNSRVTLYFYGDTHLVPISRSIGQTEGRLRAAIEGLIRGPARVSSLYRTIPKDARIEIRYIEESGRLYLDLSPELAQLAGSTQSLAALDSLLFTAGGFSEVKEIYMTVEGEEIEIFGDGLTIEQPLSPYRWTHPVYVPVYISGRYYLVPREARDLQIERRNLDGLLQASLRACSNLYFIPGDLRLIDVKQTDNTVTINLNRSLGILFPEHGDDEEKLQAALLIDALMITAVANSGAGRVEILIEGEKYEPPPGYPALDRTFTQPFYINPEQ